MRRAVIDVGSNSVLLLVAEVRDGVWVPIRETSAVTALGAGTKETGVLGERGMADTLAALREAFSIARELGAERIEAAATMAARIAFNTGEFLQRAEAQGTPVFVLAGEDEAELGFRSVAEDPYFSDQARSLPNRIAIIDVGGHSTELVIAQEQITSVEPGMQSAPASSSDCYGREGHDTSPPLRQFFVNFRRSFPIGTLGLRGSLLSAESPSSLDLLRASKAIDDLIGMECLPRLGIHVIALGATGTNLVTIRDAAGPLTPQPPLPRRGEGEFWDPEAIHGQWLDYEEVSKAAGWMSGLSDAERAAIPGIERGRERTIHIGSLILERFLFSLHVTGCSVSVRGWRHALLERE